MGGKAGYRAVGSRARYCRHDGKWSGSMLRCQPRNCGRLRKAAGTKMQCTGTTLGKLCKFTCSRGLVMNGSPVRKCLANGRWSGKRAMCVGLGYNVPVSFKSRWGDYLNALVPECQSRATSTCRCENFNIKRPQWGMNSECCAQPPQAKGAKPWCYCQSGKKWAYCQANYKPKLRVDHDVRKPTASTKFKLTKARGRKGEFMKYGDWVNVRSETSARWLASKSNFHLHLTPKKNRNAQFQLVHPRNHRYRGFIAPNMPLGLRSRFRRFIA